MRSFFKLISIFFTVAVVLSSEDTAPVIPMIPLLPALPVVSENNGVDSEETKVPIETKTVILGMEAEVVIPLEIISDVEIQAMVIDEQEIEVPFEIEMNKEPDKKDYYRLNFSETELDIDDDGQKDTYIYSNKFINSKIEKGNKVVIKGKNISKEGYHQKIVYIDVEIHD